MSLSVSVQINVAPLTSALLHDTTSGHTSAQRQRESWRGKSKRFTAAAAAAAVEEEAFYISQKAEKTALYPKPHLSHLKLCFVLFSQASS